MHSSSASSWRWIINLGRNLSKENQSDSVRHDSKCLWSKLLLFHWNLPIAKYWYPEGILRRWAEHFTNQPAGNSGIVYKIYRSLSRLRRHRVGHRIVVEQAYPINLIMGTEFICHMHQIPMKSKSVLKIHRRSHGSHHKWYEGLRIGSHLSKSLAFVIVVMLFLNYPSIRKAVVRIKGTEDL